MLINNWIQDATPSILVRSYNQWSSTTSSGRLLSIACNGWWLGNTVSWLKSYMYTVGCQINCKAIACETEDSAFLSPMETSWMCITEGFYTKTKQLSSASQFLVVFYLRSVRDLNYRIYKYSGNYKKLLFDNNFLVLIFWTVPFLNVKRLQNLLCNISCSKIVNCSYYSSALKILFNKLSISISEFVVLDNNNNNNAFMKITEWLTN